MYVISSYTAYTYTYFQRLHACMWAVRMGMRASRRGISHRLPSCFSSSTFQPYHSLDRFFVAQLQMHTHKHKTRAPDNPLPHRSLCGCILVLSGSDVVHHQQMMAVSCSSCFNKPKHVIDGHRVQGIRLDRAIRSHARTAHLGPSTTRNMLTAIKHIRVVETSTRRHG